MISNFNRTFYQGKCKNNYIGWVERLSIILLVRTEYQKINGRCKGLVVTKPNFEFIFLVFGGDFTSILVTDQVGSGGSLL